MTNNVFPSMYRIVKSADFKDIFQSGYRSKAIDLRICCKLNQFSYMRLAVVVSKKYGKAHERNLFKRHVREAFRIHSLRFTHGIDIIILPIAKKKEISWQQIVDDLNTLILKAQKKLT